MNCSKCNGLFTTEICSDQGNIHRMFRCINCGDLVDNKVHEHRMLQALEREGHNLQRLLVRKREISKF
jgi:uncharacterized Zn finger protein